MIETPKRTELPDQEWNLFADPRSLPRDYELNAWLNYEYARSCRPIVEAVEQVRSRKASPTSVPRFALFLAKTFPEFPKTPWRKIAAARMGELRGQGIIPPLDPFKDSEAIRVHDVHDFISDVETEAIVLGKSDVATEEIILGNIGAKRFAVVEINFQVDDRGIVDGFANWLGQRRRDLSKRYDRTTTPPTPGVFNANYPFAPAKPKPARGQKNNKRQYLNYLKRLAALRLLRFHKDWEGAQVQADCGIKVSYNGEQSWKRAAEEAAELMMRFLCVWKHDSGFVFILDPKRLQHRFIPGLCRLPLPPKRKQLNSMRPEIRKFIEDQVLAGG